jgi:CMP-N-acetylneuraminic acid synthetase
MSVKDGKRVLAAILARGGSKGLPGKNALPLLGKPVVVYTIEYAEGVPEIDRVVVSTDSEEIASVSGEAGAEVIMRPAEMATDDAPVEWALRHVVRRLEEEGESFDLVVLLYGNVPVRPEGIVSEAIEKMVSTGCDSVVSLCEVGKYHPQWQYRLDGDQVANYEEPTTHLRQELPKSYLHEGAVAVVSTGVLMKSESEEGPEAFLGHDRRAVITEQGETVEVDSAADMALAEFLLSAGRGK